jgi:hypothetical protein
VAKTMVAVVVEGVGGCWLRGVLYWDGLDWSTTRRKQKKLAGRTAVVPRQAVF